MGGSRDVDWNPDCGNREDDECYQRIDLIAAAVAVIRTSAITDPSLLSSTRQPTHVEAEPRRMELDRSYFRPSVCLSA